MANVLSKPLETLQTPFAVSVIKRLTNTKNKEMLKGLRLLLGGDDWEEELLVTGVEHGILTDEEVEGIEHFTITLEGGFTVTLFSDGRRPCLYEESSESYSFQFTLTTSDAYNTPLCEGGRLLLT